MDSAIHRGPRVSAWRRRAGPRPQAGRSGWRCANPLRQAAGRACLGGARYVHYVFANPVDGRQSRRSRLTAIALVVVGAVVLSTATVLGLHWATASSRKAPAMAQSGQLGFTKLHRQ